MKECRTCKRAYNASSRHRDCPKCRAIKAKKPCADCGKLIWRLGNKCISCLSKSRTGENSPTWKGGRSRHQSGYIYKQAPNHPRGKNYNKYVFEHILMMEESLDRYLVEGENIHHRNGIRDDNRIENLELWTKPQPTGIRVRDSILWAKEVLKRYGRDETKY